MLLALDVLAALVFRAAPGCVDAIGRLSLASFTRPGLFFWALLIGSIIVYVPAVLYFGASRWFAVGPVAIQASRILLYLLYFFAGVGIGAVRSTKACWPATADWRGAGRYGSAIIVTYGCIVGLIYIKHSVLPDVNHQPIWWTRLCAGVRGLQRGADLQHPGAVPALRQ